MRGFEGLDVGDRFELRGTDRAGGLRFVCPGSGIGKGGLFVFFLIKAFLHLPLLKKN